MVTLVFFYDHRGVQLVTAAGGLIKDSVGKYIQCNFERRTRLAWDCKLRLFRAFDDGALGY